MSISRTGPQEGAAELESALEIPRVLVSGPGRRQHDDQSVMVTGYAPFFLSPRFLLIPSPRGISMVEGLNRESGRATEAVEKAYATELQTGAR